MGLKSAQDAAYGDESRRDSRLKLILLAVTVILVAGYAAWMTQMDDLVRSFIAGLVATGWPALGVAGLISAAVIVALVLVYRRRRRPTARIGRAVGARARSASAGRTVRAEFAANVSTRIEAHGKSGRQFAVHLIDIDGFRALNGLLGEAEGDAFLNLVNERLLVLVNHPDRLARIGDDEFAIIQPEAGGARHAEIYARRIQETLKDACAQVPHHAQPSASIGIAVFPEHGDDATALMHAASLALHAAKHAGGDSFVIYSRDMEIEAEARREMEGAISEGLQQGWFALHFQPQYDLQTRRLVGFEALVRMNHPERGELAPSEFMTVAEESRVILPFGEWVMREALSAASGWPQHLTLSVSVSLAQLRRGDVAGSVLGALSMSGVDPLRLHVYVPEEAVAESGESVVNQLQRLKAHGVAVVLQDFGLHRSRLKALSQSCNAVRLDPSLISGIGEEPEAETLIAGLIGTAKAFRLDMLAAGVSEVKQAHVLLANGCRHVQGPLFGRPVTASDLGAIVAKDTRKAAAGGAAPAKPSRSAA